MYETNNVVDAHQIAQKLLINIDNRTLVMEESAVSYCVSYMQFFLEDSYC